jgi:hypothetical protein
MLPEGKLSDASQVGLKAMEPPALRQRMEAQPVF